MFNAVKIFGGWIIRNYATISAGYVISDIFGGLFGGDGSDEQNEKEPKKATGLIGLYQSIKNWLSSIGIGKYAAGFIILFVLYIVTKFFSARKK